MRNFTNEKTQIIKKIVGEKLKDYGFTFLETDGPIRIFVREAHGFKRYYDPETDVVKQYIYIQDSSFSKSVTARFCTDVYGNEMVHTLAVLKKYGTGDWLGYLDEESYKERLRLLTGHIIKEGFDLLEELSCEEEVIPTKAMAEKLFQQHKQLGQAFADEFLLKSVPEKPEDIDEWFRFIKKLILDTSELPYEDVKELLVKMAAFIGEKACEMCPYQWEFSEYAKTPHIVADHYLYPRNGILDHIVTAWKSKCNDLYWQFIEALIEVLKQSLVK